MHQPRFLIVDNITYITSESQDPKIATRFMKRLLALQRVYRLTGETDAVAPNTTRVGALLKKHKVPVKVRIAPGMGHELAREQMITTYRRPLSWLALGK